MSRGLMCRAVINRPCPWGRHPTSAPPAGRRMEKKSMMTITNIRTPQPRTTHRYGDALRYLASMNIPSENLMMTPMTSNHTSPTTQQGCYSTKCLIPCEPWGERCLHAKMWYRLRRRVARTSKHFWIRLPAALEAENNMKISGHDPSSRVSLGSPVTEVFIKSPPDHNDLI